MNKYTKNAPIALHIEDIVIRQDADGRYCLNDLHKASGGNPKHKPDNFLRLDTTKALIDEIDHFSDVRSDSSDIRNAIQVINGGNNRGTYVAKELVYAYSMWISPAFTLKVIRTFDAVQAFAKTAHISMTDMIRADKYIHELAQKYLGANDAWRKQALMDSLIEFCAKANKPLPSFDLIGKAIEQDQGGK
ncbi:MAG: KilA-N domain-containing protein [Gammaproteobacteria bacterium]